MRLESPLNHLIAAFFFADMDTVIQHQNSCL
jgi:hypothetical protein